MTQVITRPQITYPADGSVVPVERAVWQPFQLNPEIPAEGIGRRQYSLGKLGDFDRLVAMEQMLSESGGKDGIRFKFDLIQRIPNTMAAHRLMRLAARTQHTMPGQGIGHIDAQQAGHSAMV